MTIDHLTTGLRVYSAAVAVLVAIVGTCQWRSWLTFLPVNQLAWLALALYNVTACYGSIESLARNVPGGVRTPLTALAVTFALYAVGLDPAKVLWRKWRVHRITRRSARDRADSGDARPSPHRRWS